MTILTGRFTAGVAVVFLVVFWTCLLSLPAGAVDPTPTAPTSEPTPTEPTPTPTAEPAPAVANCASADSTQITTPCYVELNPTQLTNVTESAAKVEFGIAVVVFLVALHVVAGFGRYGRG